MSEKSPKIDMDHPSELKTILVPSHASRDDIAEMTSGSGGWVIISSHLVPSGAEQSGFSNSFFTLARYD